MSNRKVNGRRRQSSTTPLRIQMLELCMFRPRYCCQGSLKHVPPVKRRD